MEIILEMSKKSQVSGMTIFYIIAIITSVVIIVFGYTGIKNVFKGSDLGESILFETQIKEDILYMYSSPGSVIEEEYAIPASIEKVYFIDTKKIRDLSRGYVPTGKYSVQWDGKDNFGNDVSSGVYFSNVEFNGKVQTKKMMLMR